MRLALLLALILNATLGKLVLRVNVASVVWLCLLGVLPQLMTHRTR